MHLIIFTQDEASEEVLEYTKKAEEIGAAVVVSTYDTQYPVDEIVEKAQWATHCLVLVRNENDGCLSAQLAVCVAMGIIVVTDTRWFNEPQGAYTEVVKHVTKGITYKISNEYTQHCDRAFMVRLVMLVRGGTEVKDGTGHHVTISTSDVNRNTDAYGVLLWPSFIDWLWEGGPVTDYVVPPAQKAKVSFLATPGGTLATEVHLLTPRSGRQLKIRRRKDKPTEAPPMPLLPPPPVLELDTEQY